MCGLFFLFVPLMPLYLVFETGQRLPITLQAAFQRGDFLMKLPRAGKIVRGGEQAIAIEEHHQQPPLVVLMLGQSGVNILRRGGGGSLAQFLRG